MKTISTAFPEQPSALLQWSVEEQQVFLIVRAYSTGVYTAPFHADSTACTSAVSVSREVPELATLQLQVSDAPSDGPEVIESGRPYECGQSDVCSTTPKLPCLPDAAEVADGPLDCLLNGGTKT